MHTPFLRAVFVLPQLVGVESQVLKSVDLGIRGVGSSEQSLPPHIDPKIVMRIPVEPSSFVVAAAPPADSRVASAVPTSVAPNTYPEARADESVEEAASRGWWQSAAEMHRRRWSKSPIARVRAAGALVQ